MTLLFIYIFENILDILDFSRCDFSLDIRSDQPVNYKSVDDKYSIVFQRWSYQLEKLRTGRFLTHHGHDSIAWSPESVDPVKIIRISESSGSN